MVVIIMANEINAFIFILWKFTLPGVTRALFSVDAVLSTLHVHELKHCEAMI